MHLMRIGAVGAKEPVARIDGGTYVDLSDVVGAPIARPHQMLCLIDGLGIQRRTVLGPR